MGKPLNGKARMTRLEREERRKELDRDPFHHALTRKTRKAWYARNKERLNAKRRKRYADDAEFHDSELAKQRARRKANPEKSYASFHRYYEAHRSDILAREKVRDQRPEVRARHNEILRRRREQFHSDPVFREKIRAQKRAQWERRKHRESYRRSVMRNHFIPYWTDVVAGGKERIASYLKLAKPKNRHAFMLWYTQNHGLLDTHSPTVSVNPNPEADD